MKVMYVLAGLLGIGVAVVMMLARSQGDGGSRIGMSNPTVTLQEIRDLSELRVMRVEVATLQWVTRNEPAEHFWQSDQSRRFAQIVPVEIDYGVDLKSMVVKGSGKEMVLQLPTPKVVRYASRQSDQDAIIWVNEGNAFMGEEWGRKAMMQGERAAIRKAAGLKLDPLLKSTTSDVLKELCENLGVKGVKVEFVDGAEVVAGR